MHWMRSSIISGYIHALLLLAVLLLLLPASGQIGSAKFNSKWSILVDLELVPPNNWWHQFNATAAVSELPPHSFDACTTCMYC